MIKRKTAFIYILLLLTALLCLPNITTAADEAQTSVIDIAAAADALQEVKEEAELNISDIAGAGAEDSEQEAPQDEDEIEYKGKKIKLPGIQRSIAQNLQKVMSGDMTSIDFYKDLGRLGATMFDVMKVKTHILNTGGTDMVHHFLGEQYKPEGGSQVEMKLMNDRIKLVDAGIKYATSKAGLGPGAKSAYLAYIGGWKKASERALTVYGDIDFSFVSADDAVLKELQRHFNDYIVSNTGLSQVALDALCTRHGKASTEVYLAKHGADFGRSEMIKGELYKLRPSGPDGKGENGQKIFSKLFMESYMVDADDRIDLGKHATDPGLSMEMIRHFEHDIVKGQKNFSPIDLFLKATKYLKRSDDSMIKEISPAKHMDTKLSNFVQELTALKEAGPQKQLEKIKEFYGGKLPFDADVKISKTGFASATIEANKQLTNQLFDMVRKSMWNNAESVFKDKFTKMDGDFKRLKESSKSKSAQTKAKKKEQVRRKAEVLKAKLFELKQMVEIEFVALKNDGVPIPASIQETKKRLDKMVDDFNKSFEGFNVKKISIEQMKELEYVKELVRTKKSTAIALAAAHVIKRASDGVERANSILDFADDWLLGRLRGEQGFDEFLNEYRDTRTKLDDPDLPAGKKASIIDGFKQQAQKKYFADIQNRLNTRLHNNCVARGIAKPNIIFSEHLQRNAADRAGMKALAAFNLAMEIDAYYNAYNNQGWQGMVTELVRRRVPFGSTVDHAIQGNYMMATWDVVTTLVPPLALPEAAWGMGVMVTESSINLYWSTELTLFVDQLYDKATFELMGDSTVKYGEGKVGNWKLVKFKYKGKEVVVSEFLAINRDAEQKFLALLKLKLEDREYPDYTRGLTDNIQEEMILSHHLKDKDPLLNMLKGLIKGEYAGERVKWHFKDQRTARWLTVKLNFIEQMIQKLEARKQAEMAINMGQLEDILKEFERVLDELKIKKEVLASLTGKIGLSSTISMGLESDISEFLEGKIQQAIKDKTLLTDQFKAEADMRAIEETYDKAVDLGGQALDTIVDTKRMLYDEGAVEYSAVKEVRILLDYVDAYSTVLKVREFIEKQFIAKHTEDQGMRVLTGPEYLEANPALDKNKALGLIKELDRSGSEVAEELTEIKQEIIPEAALNDEFDKRIMEKVLLHVIWWDQWQMVFQKNLKVEKMQDKALARAKFHGEERKKLIQEFKDHYMNMVKLTVRLRIKKGKDEVPVTGADIRIPVKDEDDHVLREEGMDAEYVLDTIRTGEYSMIIQTAHPTKKELKIKQEETIIIPDVAEGEKREFKKTILLKSDEKIALADDLKITLSHGDDQERGYPIESGGKLQAEKGTVWAVSSVTFPETEEPLKVKVIWSLKDHDHFILSTKIDELEGTGETREIFMKIPVKDLSEGTYSLMLRQYLIEDPKNGVEARASFTKYQPVKIVDLWATDKRGSTKKKTGFMPEEIPLVYFTFNMDKTMEAVLVEFFVTKAITGEELYYVPNEYIYSPDRKVQKTGLRLPEGLIEPGNTITVLASISRLSSTKGSFETVTKSMDLSVISDEGLKIRASRVLIGDQSGRYSIKVPKGFKGPYSVRIGGDGLKVRKSSNPLRGKIQGSISEDDRTHEMNFQVKDGEGRTLKGTAKVIVRGLDRKTIENNEEADQQLYSAPPEPDPEPVQTQTTEDDDPFQKAQDILNKYNQESQQIKDKYEEKNQEIENEYKYNQPPPTPGWSTQDSQGQQQKTYKTISIDADDCRKAYWACSDRCAKLTAPGAAHACRNPCSAASLACKKSKCPGGTLDGSIGWNLRCRILQ